MKEAKAAGGEKKCIDNFGGEPSWKLSTCKTQREMGG
jgi:hypothetical protein